ncbi:MAG: alpha-1,4-glucan--maltose-1-phosphate maltosyltransferase [Arcanobacterium sp.]|nr:alpha-1,4-glucan--maltose-1-phosphate maltosyltransferase [Arcanobacterium sp.]
MKKIKTPVNTPNPIGRIPIVDVSPVLADGTWPAKATEYEAIPVQATIFREGHDLFSAQAVLFNPAGEIVQEVPMVDIAPGLRRHEAWVTPTFPGTWSFEIQAWSDPYATWLHNSEIKLDAKIDLPLIFLEAAALLKRALKNLPRGFAGAEIIRAAIHGVGKETDTPETRFAAATSAEVKEILRQYPLQDGFTRSKRYFLNVDRAKALTGSWYEIFPRTTGAKYDEKTKTWTSGTFATAQKDLDRIAKLGFDVVYLTPIHPIGTTNRKGRNNTLLAYPGDPGSPYAIGSAEGGHDTIHPDLGTFADFTAFVNRAKELGLEVALDIALQCSPDHPWVKAHPEWFTTRADGTIAYAENPPKKYQDIYPLNFDNDPEGIYQEIKRMLLLWVEAGVTLFRVDNPHTKPLDFWQRLLQEFRAEHPEIIFLAEAFTQPPMMQTLGAIGFHQSYTYFTWRNEKQEIEAYLNEVSRISDARIRPAFWPTTHDILTPYMQRGGRPAFAIRAILAATAAPTWGIYSGYELIENIARPGAEEQIDNEKYEYKERDYSGAEYEGMATLLTQLNKIRRDHLALQRLRNIQIHETTNEKILCFSKVSRPEEDPSGKGETDAVIVVLNLDPYTSREATINLDLHAFGATPRWNSAPAIEVTDELSGATYLWNEQPYVRLDPHGQVAHILRVKVLPNE